MVPYPWVLILYMWNLIQAEIMVTEEPHRREQPTQRTAIVPRISHRYQTMPQFDMPSPFISLPFALILLELRRVR